jgi:hypothetical protein
MGIDRLDFGQGGDGLRRCRSNLARNCRFQTAPLESGRSDPETVEAHH